MKHTVYHITDATGKSIFVQATNLELERGGADKTHKEIRPYFDLWIGHCAGTQNDGFLDAAVRLEFLETPFRIETIVS